MKTNERLWTRWAPLLALTALLAACGAAVTPEPAATPGPEEPAPEPAARTTCEDSAIRLLASGAGIHGAIVADTLHMGGATAPATCLEPANQSLLAGASTPDGRTAQVQQSRYYLIVIRYPGGNRLYVLSRRGDGTSCVVDTNDECIAQVTDLPDDFDLEELPDDVAPTIPAGRPAGPSPGDDETPAPSPPAGDDETPPAGPPPGEGAPPPATGTAPGAASTPQPSDGATGVTVGGPLLSWAAAPRALSYDVYWGATKVLAGRPINTSSTFWTIASSADLAAETVYYWRVDAKNEAGSTKGAVWSFTTAPAPPAEETPAAPGAPTLPAASGPLGAASSPQPSDGATGVAVDAPVLSWAAVTGAVSYDVTWHEFESSIRTGHSMRVNTSSTSVNMSSRASGEPTGRLEGGRTYYWQVDAKKIAGVGDGNVGHCRPASACTSGEIWSFTTGSTAPPAAPGAPSKPLQPNDGATGVTVDGPLLKWSATPRALSYDVHWAVNESAITSGLTTPTNTASTSVRMTGELDAATTYYWRVDAKNETGTTRSDVWSFTTGQPSPREAPAWSAAATRLKIEGVAEDPIGPGWTLDPPTGNPTPTVSITGRPSTALLSFDKYSLTFRKTHRYVADSGTMTLVASNSVGTATLELPYRFTCLSIATTFERLQGTWDWDRSGGPYRRVVISDSDVTATLHTGTEIGPLGFKSFTRYLNKPNVGLLCPYIRDGSLTFQISEHMLYANELSRCHRYIHVWRTGDQTYDWTKLKLAGC